MKSKRIRWGLFFFTAAVLTSCGKQPSQENKDTGSAESPEKFTLMSASCGNSSIASPYLVQTSGMPTDLEHEFTIHPHFGSFTERESTGKNCKSHERVKYTFSSKGTVKINSLSEGVISDAKNDPTCPPPSIQSLVDHHLYSGEYSYVTNQGTLVLTSKSDHFCSQRGYPGSRVTLTLVKQ